MYNIAELIRDQLLGSLKVYEMRITKGKLATRDVTFKVDKKSTKEQECSCSDSDEV